jgi:N-acetylglucosamine-6-phosphate deacetylase
MNELTGTLVSPDLSYPGVVRFDTHVQGVEALPSAPKRYLLPGFVDLHVHGGGGADFMEGEAAVRQVARFHARHGTTALLATTVTAPLEDLEAALSGINQVIERPGPGEARLLGVHLEGPFINPAKLGAQPPYALNPDLGLMQHFLRLAPIKVVTLAPELPGALELIGFLAEQNVTVQIGHTAASYEEAKAGLGAGARGFTHFFNAMTPLHHREPGVAGLGLERGEWAEVIGDGLHVHPAVVRALWKAIPYLYTVTDAVAAAGMPEGEYRLGRNPVFRRGSGIFLADGTLAGSSLTLDQAVRNLVRWGLSLGDTVALTSARPRAYLGEAPGALEAGAQADLVVLNEQLEVEGVYIAGQPVLEVREPGARRPEAR